MKKTVFAIFVSLILVSACSGGKSEKEKSGGDSAKATVAKVDTSLPQGMVIPEKSDSVKIESAGKPGAIVRITKNGMDPFTVCAGLKTAEELADKFAVVVYFDLRGVEVPLKASPDFEFAPYPKAKAQLKKLREKGVTMVVSRTALAAAWKKAEDLEAGISVTDPGEVMSFTDKKIVTLEF